YPATRFERPEHLGNGSRSVGEELQTLLAGHDIEGGVGHRQRVCRGNQVLDRRAVRSPLATGQLDHRPAEIGANDPAGWPESTGGNPGDGTRAGGNVQQRLAWPGCYHLHQQLRPGDEDPRHIDVVVGIGHARNRKTRSRLRLGHLDSSRRVNIWTPRSSCRKRGTGIASSSPGCRTARSLWRRSPHRMDTGLHSPSPWGEGQGGGPPAWRAQTSARCPPAGMYRFSASPWSISSVPWSIPPS